MTIEKLAGYFYFGECVSTGDSRELRQIGNGFTKRDEGTERKRQLVWWEKKLRTTDEWFMSDRLVRGCNEPRLHSHPSIHRVRPKISIMFSQSVPFKSTRWSLTETDRCTWNERWVCCHQGWVLLKLNLIQWRVMSWINGRGIFLYIRQRPFERTPVLLTEKEGSL